MRSNSGFTLLETMIAMTIMVIAFGSILAIQGASIQTAIKAKQVHIASMLAKNLMVETELKMEGKAFNDLKEEETGTYPSPYEDFTWKRTVKEVKFPSLDILGGGNASGADQAADSKDKKDDATQSMVGQLVGKYLSQAIREVTVSIAAKRAGGEQIYNVTTYWVNLNNDFQLTP